VVVFRPLGEQELRKIVELQLERVAHLASELGLVLEVTDEAKGFLAREGYDPAFGARPLKRAIQPLTMASTCACENDSKTACAARALATSCCAWVLAVVWGSWTQVLMVVSSCAPPVEERTDNNCT
jgi:hypothetical protein